MSNVPAGLKFTRSHEWVKQLPDGISEIGITDHAQHALGDLVFVELPEIGRSLRAGEACAVVESVKAASDIYSPLGGTVVAVNDQLRHSPELINRDPYGGGWLVRLRPALPAGPDAASGLLSASEYRALTPQD
ncbi:MAG TPA: glycine cleavage system protein GcvH [Steroidobacteraceae bacterium]